MLEALRKSAGSWVAKVFIGLLVVSFAVWGIADIFRGYGSGALATVGDTEISPEAFRSAFQQEMQRAGRQFGQALSLDQARQLGLDGRVLGRMVAEATLDNDVRTKQLGISNEAVAKSIAEDPAFRDGSGRFNRGYFQQVLRQNGLSEAGYVARERELHLRQQLTNSLVAGNVAPQVLVDAVHRYQSEQRSIAYLVVSASMLAAVPAPDEAALREYFTANKAQFRAPEYRMIEIIEADPTLLAKDTEIPQSDIEALYETRKASLGSPEKREVQQIVFPTLEEAKAASDRIKAGASFADIAKERGLSEKETSLGLLEASGLIDKAVRDVAFSLVDGAISEPVQGALGAAIVRVVRIEPGSTRPLADVRDALKQELAAKQASARVLDLHDKVEDLRASGAPFPEIAGKLNLPYRTIDAMDAGGRDANGVPIAGLPGGRDVPQVAFDTDPGLEVDPIQTVAGGFVWLNVLGITPDRDRTLEEVRADVEKAWRAEDERRRLSQRASELLERLRAGTSMEEIAKELKQPLTITPPLTRETEDATLSPAAIQAAFAVPVQDFASSQHHNGTDRVLMQVRRATVPELDSSGDQIAVLRRGVANSIANDILAQYIGAKQDAFGVKVNQQALRAVLGQP